MYNENNKLEKIYEINKKSNISSMGSKKKVERKRKHTKNIIKRRKDY